ncbi:cobyrinate a,c-diamide synthase [Paraconexibacter sp.]|uniref:cobyrinate a,c-diamide synthase n=1 Tax=Paraconexibacter sp. TaxID=2949640 RepID=UPI00356ABF02
MGPVVAVIPRIVIAGTSSGAGKTSVACGIIGALRARGHVVQGFKVGPDYIDPTYHALASGRPGRNLDAFLSGPELIGPLVEHGSNGADIAVVEGVMGLFDGASGRGELASTAHVAKLLDAPVLLVVDAAAMARSAAAIVHGYRTFDPDVAIAGVILNRVGSDHHEDLLREAIEPLGVPVVGALRRDERVAAPERHLGLVPVVEREQRSRAALDALAECAARYVDLDAVVRLGRGAGDHPTATAEPWSASAAGDGTPRARVAIAAGPAFSFHYTENLELLTAAGAELAPFDPTVDPTLPDGSDALILAGGFPEVHGEALAANDAMRADIARFAASGAPVIAECGGLLYLCRTLDELPMCGVLAADASMAGRLTLGYREATAESDSAVWLAGDHVRGHEFHYSATVPGHGERAAWTLRARGRERPEGVIAGGVHASYLHTHWAASPQTARRFVDAALGR